MMHANTAMREKAVGGDIELLCVPIIYDYDGEPCAEIVGESKTSLLEDGHICITCRDKRC